MINFTITKALHQTLESNNIKADDYAPAYTGESAGLDLYNTGEHIHIYPSSASYDDTVQIATGIKINVPKGYVGLIKERGSISKTPLKVRAGVVDSGYTGEVFVNCVNIGQRVYTIYKDNKLPFQIIIVKCDNEFKIVDNKEFDSIVKSSKRKSGKIGSSDS